VATLNALVVNFETPLVSPIVARVEDPFLKVTLPVGLPLVDVTEVVKVTDCPEVEGFRDEVSDTEGVSLPILATKP
jgi:hypothetical protein